MQNQSMLLTDEYLRVGKCWDTINTITRQKALQFPKLRLLSCIANHKPNI